MDNDYVIVSLEALVERVTRASNKVDDLTAISAIRKLISTEQDGGNILARLIIEKLQSQNERELIQTLNLLAACMDSGCPGLRIEVGKFRFLNELIKLVSPKFLKDKTPVAVRNQIIYLLRKWCLKYPNESKILEAYSMLQKQGVVIEDEPLTGIKPLWIKTPTPKEVRGSVSRKASSTEDPKSTLLKKLLQSKNRKDVVAANSLIKNIVLEKEIKEKQERLEIEMKEQFTVVLEDNLSLLNDTMDCLTRNSSSQDLELVEELYNNCTKMKPSLQKFITNSSKFCEKQLLEQLLSVNDYLNETFIRYEAVLNEINNGESESNHNSEGAVEHQASTKYATQSHSSDSALLLDLDSPIKRDRSNKLSTSEVVFYEHNPKLKGPSSGPPKNNLDALEEIFGSTAMTPTTSNDLLEDKLDLNLNENEKTAEGKNGIDNLKPLKAELPKYTGVRYIYHKVSINTDNDIDETLSPTGSDDDISPEVDSKNSDFPELENADDDDDVPLLISDGTNDELLLAEKAAKETQVSIKPVQPIADISVPFDTIIPDDVIRNAIQDQNGVTVLLQLTKNKPRNDVTVYLVIISSMNKKPISDVIFQPIVPKECRLKVQYEGRSDLAPYNPHIPNSNVVQVMLISANNKEFIPLKFAISYKLEGEIATEMGEIGRLPLN